jgi:hypothetical protein
MPQEKKGGGGKLLGKIPSHPTALPLMTVHARGTLERLYIQYTARPTVSAESLTTLYFLNSKTGTPLILESTPYTSFSTPLTLNIKEQ